MTLFNHTVEYSTELFEEETGGQFIELRKAIVEYDDFWGERRTHVFAAPSDLWTTVKVGGTASAGVPPSMGIVTDVRQGVFRTVWVQDAVGEITCSCLPTGDDFQAGDTGLVVEHMRHDSGEYGTFRKCIMRNLPAGANPNLHSVNLLLFNGDEQVGVIHLDPYLEGVANYDDMDLSALDGWLAQ